jgi:glycosyltransferase involved in cell wall biosynthesis
VSIGLFAGNFVGHHWTKHLDFLVFFGYTRRMKIAHIVATYPPYRGGMGNVAETYVTALRARGEHVDVFTPDSFPGIWRFGHAAIMPQLVRALQSYDLIHLHYPFYGSALFAVLAAVLYRKPIVLTYHMRTKAKGLKGWIFRLHRWFIEPFILMSVDRILVSSDEYAASVALTGRHTEVLPFGVDARRFSPGPKEKIRLEHGISKDAWVILFVGGLDSAHYFKGVEVLLNACAGLEKTDWHLLLVGEEGDGRAYYETLANKLGVKARVHFAGKVSTDYLPHYYRAADMHVLPSIDRSEAFGLVTLEAAATGIPSVVSDLPGVRTLVEHGQTGWHVTPGDEQSLKEAMQLCASDRDACLVMGERARFRIETIYQNDVVIDRLQEIYRDLKMEGQEVNERI